MRRVIQLDTATIAAQWAKVTHGEGQEEKMRWEISGRPRKGDENLAVEVTGQDG